MRSRIILDTGPLVALLNRHDNYHTWARTCLSEAEPPLLTCEAVLSEACFLVRALPNGPLTVIDLLQHRVVARRCTAVAVGQGGAGRVPGQSQTGA